MKTHKVIDLTYHKEENNECFIGTYNECISFVAKQGVIGYKIVLMTKEEMVSILKIN